MWIPKDEALIRGRRIFEAWRLLEEFTFKIITNISAKRK